MKITNKTIAGIIRIVIILISVYSVLEMILAYNGIYNPHYIYIFGHSFLLDIVIIILVRKQGTFHCRYMRILAYNMLLSSFVNFIDNHFGIFTEPVSYFVFIFVVWFATILALLILAINHFRNAIKAKKERELNNK